MRQGKSLKREKLWLLRLQSLKKTLTFDETHWGKKRLFSRDNGELCNSPKSFKVCKFLHKHTLVSFHEKRLDFGIWPSEIKAQLHI